MNFETLGLSASLLRAVSNEGYSIPTPVQAEAIPHVLAGRDLVACAQTGTGKTAAFALPILHLLSATSSSATGPAEDRRRPIRVLVLSPTRELASQIEESFRVYGRHTGLKQTVIYGGIKQHSQVRALKARVDILVATPGRLLDLMNQGYVKLDDVSVLVLDEADRMLDMGFIHDIRTICAKIPTKRQTLLFSATMPREIRGLADSLMRDPARVQVAAESTPAERIEQSVYFVDKRHKPTLLNHVLEQAGASRTLVFTRTKHGADRVVRDLQKKGIRAEAIHGDKSQAMRQRALANFKSARPPVLVATDVAARGLDVDDISHVINYDVPMIAETYVHRIGRTARAGAAGVAVSFCDRDERAHLKSIERLMRATIRVEATHPAYPELPRSESVQHSDKPHNNRPANAGRPPFGRPQSGGYGRSPRVGANQSQGQSQVQGQQQEQGQASAGSRPFGGKPPVRRPKGKRPPNLGRRARFAKSSSK